MKLLTRSLLLIALILSAGNVRAELTKDSSLDDILDALDARGKDLKSFAADVAMTETDTQTGDSKIRDGKAWFQMKTDDDGRIRVDFTTVRIEGDSQSKEQRIIYILDNGKFIDRNYKGKKQASHQVLKPGEKINLLKLGEGPFPLPIGQPKEKVKSLFTVTKIDPAKDDPVDTIHIKLVPLPDTEYRKFKSIDAWVDLKQNMPLRIVTEDATFIRDTQLKNVQLNPTLSDKDFELPEIDLKEWNVTED